MATENGTIVIPIEVEKTGSDETTSSPNATQKSATPYYSTITRKFDTTRSSTSGGNRVSLSQRSPLASPNSSRPGSRQRRSNEFDGYLSKKLQKLICSVVTGGTFRLWLERESTVMLFCFFKLN